MYCTYDVCACVLLYHPIWCTRIMMYVSCESARVFMTVTYSMGSGRLEGSHDTFPSRRVEQYRIQPYMWPIMSTNNMKSTKVQNPRRKCSAV